MMQLPKEKTARVKEIIRVMCFIVLFIFATIGYRDEDEEFYHQKQKPTPNSNVGSSPFSKTRIGSTDADKAIGPNLNIAPTSNGNIPKP